MTAIVGLVHDGLAYIGADSISASPCSASVSAVPKLFRRGPYLIAGAGEWRMIHVLHYRLDVPKPPAGGRMLHRFMATTFLDTLRAALRDVGAMKVEYEVEDAGDAVALVGIFGRLFTFQSDGAVLEDRHGYATEGAGADVMNGALYATRDSDVGPRERIRLALRAASEHTPFVRGPFRVLAERPK